MYTVIVFEVGPQSLDNCCLDYQIIQTHHTYAEELSFIKRRASPYHALGFWHLWFGTHSQTRCVFYLKIKLQFLSLDSALMSQFHFPKLS